MQTLKKVDKWWVIETEEPNLYHVESRFGNKIRYANYVSFTEAHKIAEGLNKQGF